MCSHAGCPFQADDLVEVDRHKQGKRHRDPVLEDNDRQVKGLIKEDPRNLDHAQKGDYMLDEDPWVKGENRHRDPVLEDAQRQGDGNGMLEENPREKEHHDSFLEEAKEDVHKTEPSLHEEDDDPLSNVQVELEIKEERDDANRYV